VIGQAKAPLVEFILQGRSLLDAVCLNPVGMMVLVELMRR
jgi:hypothetical protein